MEGGLALDALGDIDGEFDAVVAEGVGGGGSVDGGTTVTAEDPAWESMSVYPLHTDKPRSTRVCMQKRREGTYVALVCVGCCDTDPMGTGASSRSIDMASVCCAGLPGKRLDKLRVVFRKGIQSTWILSRAETKS